MRKRFPFNIVTDSWLTYDSNLALEINGYKSYSVSRTGPKGGDIKLLYFDYTSTEVISQLFVKEDSHESIFVKASIPGLGNKYVAGIYLFLNKPLTDFTRFITGAMEYTNRYPTVVLGDLNIDFMNNSNMTHN